MTRGFGSALLPFNLISDSDAISDVGLDRPPSALDLLAVLTAGALVEDWKWYAWLGIFSLSLAVLYGAMIWNAISGP